ncbi:MAG: hypothetical protein IJ378_06810 [Alistipes sp.]|nr:hypothetical protein [Alistipes sp.]
MKRLFFSLFFIFSIFVSQATVIQVYCILNTDGHQLYEDNQIKVTLTTNETGNICLAIANITDRIIYIDKGNSFCYTNGIPNTLFINASHTIGEATQGGTSINMGSIARALKINGPVGTVLSGVNIGGSNTQYNSTTIHEQRIMAIAPNSIHVLHVWEYSDMITPIYNSIGNGKTIRPRKAGRHWIFNETNTPLHINSVISYASSEDMADAKQISVSDYVNEIVTGGKKSSYSTLPQYNTHSNSNPYKDRTFFQFEEGFRNGLKIMAIVSPILLVTAWVIGDN